MRYSTAMIVAAMSIGEAVAGPAHAHLHRHAHSHEKKDVEWSNLDWASMGVDWSSAWSAGQHTSTSAAAPTPAAASPTATKGAVFAQTTAAPASTHSTSTSSSASSSASSSSDVVSDISAGSATLFNNLVGLANEVTSFGEALASTGDEIMATGNQGSPQGHNMMKVDSVGSYQFTNEFINTSPSALTVVIWNKAYNNDPNLGSCVAPETPTLTFALAPGGKQIVAFQEGTIIGWAEATSARTLSGAYDGTWGEGKFWGSGSGFDMSSILNSKGNNYNMTIVGNGCTSGPSPSTPHWEAQDNDAEKPVPIGGSDGSCYIPGGSANLVTYMGGIIG